MTMFFARTNAAQGCGVTEAQALGGLASFYRRDDIVEVVGGATYTVTVIEFHADNFYGENVSWRDPEEWAEDVRSLELSSTGLRRLADRFDAMEREGEISNATADWRADFGDGDITYLVKHEGSIVGIEEHWDRAKDALERVEEWGGDAWIDEVDGEPEFGLTEVED